VDSPLAVTLISVAVKKESRACWHGSGIASALL